MPAMTSPRQDGEALGPRASRRDRVLSALLRPVPPPLLLALVVGAGMIAAETLVLYPLKHVAPGNLLLVVYLFGVMAVAIVGGCGRSWRQRRSASWHSTTFTPRHWVRSRLAQQRDGAMLLCTSH
jgi:hypothetical protein